MKAAKLALLVAGVYLIGLASSHQPAGAVIEQIYSLPFSGQYVKTCGYEWYSECDYPSSEFHYGTDYALGIQGIPETDGHPVQAAKRGTAKACPFGFYTGFPVLIDHGNGHRTRYLHLKEMGLPSSGGQLVATGRVIGYEGATGSDVTGPHLHFETRQNAGSFDCSNQQAGSAYDPYGGPYSPGTYSWKTNPPSTARDLDFSGDGCPDLLGRESTGTTCLVRGNGAGGWIPNPDPGCNDGSPIGWGWQVFDYMLRPGDWNGDGYSDVLMRNPGYSGGTLCLLAGYRGDGDGYWIPDAPDPVCGDATPIGYGWNVYDWIIGPGDFSGDGFNDVLARENFGNRDLCLIRGNGHGGWITDPGGDCGDGTKVGWGWGIYNWLLAPSDWGPNGDSCPDVVARLAASPYWMKYHSGNCNGGFIEQTGVNIESGWSVYDWLLSVGDFSGDVCSDILVRGGGGYLWMRKSTCNGGFTGPFYTIGFGWNVYTWIF